MFNQNPFIMKKLFTLFAAMVTFVALNAQSVDMEIVGFYEGTSPITSMSISTTQDVAPLTLFATHGPDAFPAADTLAFIVTIGDNMVNGAMMTGAMGLTGMQMDANYQLVDQSQNPFPLLTASFMEDNDLTGTFEVCLTAYIFGAATDPDLSNNQKCITVTRGTTGINELEGEVNVYPNPATTVINIDNAEGAQVSVFDINGRMISNVESASASQTIDASNFAKGMYIVRIANGNNVITKKVSVVR